MPRHRARPYDLVIHQLGNGPAHAFVYPLLAQAPGLLVLHDLVLHHSRAAMLLDTAAVRAYAADPSSVRLRDATLGGREAYAERGRVRVPREARRLVAAHEGTVGRLLPYAYPLFHLPVAVSRATAVHNLAMAARDRGGGGRRPRSCRWRCRRAAAGPRVRRGGRLRARVGGRIGRVRGRVLRPADAGEAGGDGGAGGGAGGGRTLPSSACCWWAPCPTARALDAMLERARPAGRTDVAGRVEMDELPAHIEAADVVAHLRYPTAGETSAALLRVLAQGRPASSPTSRTSATCPTTPWCARTWPTRRAT